MGKLLSKVDLQSENQIILILLGIPIFGLIYCGLVFFTMASFPILRAHPLLSGGIAALTPLTIAAAIWLGASARAYRN